LPATTITTTTYYNSGGLKEDGSKKDLSNGFRLWIDMVEPTPNELINLQNEYNLDSHAMDLIKQKAKRPQTRILDNYLFTIILDMGYKTLKQLTIEGIYMFLGKDWLITIHSSNIDLVSSVKHIFEQKNKKLKESNIDALYLP